MWSCSNDWNNALSLASRWFRGGQSLCDEHMEVVQRRSTLQKPVMRGLCPRQWFNWPSFPPPPLFPEKKSTWDIWLECSLKPLSQCSLRSERCIVWGPSNIWHLAFSDFLEQNQRGCKEWFLEQLLSSLLNSTSPRCVCVGGSVWCVWVCECVGVVFLGWAN